tara:strand:- start:12 stop:908 length:897 start_codon:yes stop_codon:yes gene_type:complete
MNLNTSNKNDYIYENLSNISDVRGVIHISHGMAEHIGRYKWLIEKLNIDGFHVIAIDHRGHGKRIKGNQKGFFGEENGWKLVIDDLLLIMNDTKKKYPNLKQYLLAHSMGSWIALGAMQAKININGLILSGSSKIPSSLLKLQILLIRMQIIFFGKKGISKFLDNITLGSYNKFFKPNRTDKDWISSDDKNVDNYIDDPLCGFMVTNSLWNDLANGMGLVFDKKNYTHTDKSIPILIISGSNDPVGENGKGVKRLYIFLKNIFKNISIEIIKDARHEVFSEVNKEDNYIVLKDFLNKN